jgi:hypothetical protein
MYTVYKEIALSKNARESQRAKIRVQMCKNRALLTTPNAGPRMRNSERPSADGQDKEGKKAFNDSSEDQ